MTRMLNLFDSHTHSDNSPDGEHSVTFMCEKAVERGLMGFCVTDHCEVDQYKEDSFELRILQSVFETKKARLYFSDQLTLTCGIELGQPLADPDTARRAMELHNYDFVLGSVHAVRGEQDFYFRKYDGLSPEQIDALLRRYLEELLETARLGSFDVLAHMTYPVRYITGRDGIPCDFNKHTEIIDEVLKTVIKTGKGLELNVAGLYGPFGRPSPTREILTRYRDLGGEIVTVGSDAHRAENVGRCIEDGMELLADCGFKYFAFYKKRAPRMLPIR